MKGVFEVKETRATISIISHIILQREVVKIRRVK